METSYKNFINETERITERATSRLEEAITMLKNDIRAWLQESRAGGEKAASLNDIISTIADAKNAIEYLNNTAATKRIAGEDETDKAERILAVIRRLLDKAGDFDTELNESVRQIMDLTEE